MSAPEFRQDTFTYVLIGDVVAVHERLKEADSQRHRRELIRTIFSAIEGLHWKLKRDVLWHADVVAKLSPHENAALMEETYSVDDRGVVRAQPRFLNLVAAIRLVVSIVQRYRPTYTVDFEHIGWANLKAAIAVRNRLVHPKSLSELTVADSEVTQAMSGFAWLLALVIEILSETNDHVKSLVEGLAEVGAAGRASDA